MDAVVTAMRSHASVAKAQVHGCGALSMLARDGNNQVPAAEVEAEDWEGKTFLITLYFRWI